MSTIQPLRRQLFTQLSHSPLIVCLVCCCAMTLPVRCQQIRRLYVAPFTTKDNSGKLRADLISELKKMSGFSLAMNKSEAEAILDGGGEVWVKGYRSLNPRSGRLPADGVPIYDGYLSVELTDTKGQTFWSYLVTPGTGAEDVSRDLAKRIAKQVGTALEQGSRRQGPRRYRSRV